jgi:hypothetical protein
MSEHGHGSHDAVPARSRISPAVWVFLMISLVVIMWQGYNVVSSSHEQHVWPASDAVKVPLPDAKP